jgi:hypothetical protein
MDSTLPTCGLRLFAWGAISCALTSKNPKPPTGGQPAFKGRSEVTLTQRVLWLVLFAADRVARPGVTQHTGVIHKSLFFPLVRLAPELDEHRPYFEQICL